MKLVTPIRPADDISAMLRKLADRVDAEPVANVFLVLERHEGLNEVMNYGPCDDPFRAAGVFLKAARDVLP